MRNSRLLIATVLLALGACTGNLTGPEATAPSAGSQNLAAPTDPSDETTVVDMLDDTGLVGSGGGRN